MTRTRPGADPLPLSRGVGSSRRIRRGLALTALTGALVVGLFVVNGTLSLGVDDPDRAARARCAEAARSMPAPWRFTERPSQAAVPSAMARAPLWTPPYDAATAAARRADQAGQPATARRLRAIAAQPRGVWLTNPDPRQVQAQTTNAVRAAVRAGRVPVLVLYAIPLRDCAGASEGGARSAADYLRSTQALVAGLRTGEVAKGPGAVVIVEPDALGLLTRLPAERQTERIDLLRATVTALAKVPNVAAYLDAGHSGWTPHRDMAERLNAAGIAMARGFSLNVANFRRTEDEVRYGEAIAPLVGWRRFVVDTSRNGNGPAAPGDWCNPAGRALGRVPGRSSTRIIDGYLWVKPPGESDGSCRAGQPAAGMFWPEYADALGRAAGW